VPGIVFAWAVGEGILVYRAYKQGAPPMPGQLLAASFLFIGCGLLADNASTSFLGSALAWGFDVAAFLNLAPSITTGGTTDGTGPGKTTSTSSSVSAGGGATTAKAQ
jgi:hypothetical protein